MAVTLSVSDTGDGSGGTATVAGTGGSDTNTIYRSAWTGDTGTLSFTSTNSRTGDGTVALSVSNSLWLWKLESVTGAGAKTCVIVYQPTSGGSTGQSVLYRIMVQMQTQIKALALTGIDSTNDVVIKWLPRNLDSTTDPKPQIVICPAPGAMVQDKSKLTATDMISYPILVAAISAQNQDYTANLARNTLWIEKISREFRWRNLTNSISEAINIIQEPYTTINPNLFSKNCLYHAMVFRVESRETRGN